MSHNPTQGKERRRHPRFLVRVPVIVVSAGEIEAGIAQDLGAGGVLLRTPHLPELGTRVSIEFVVGRRFSMRGEVVRHDTAVEAEQQKGFALRFEESNEVQDRLRHALLDQ